MIDSNSRVLSPLRSCSGSPLALTGLRRTALQASAGLLLSTFASAQVVEMVADINSLPLPASSSPRAATAQGESFLKIGGYWYFAATGTYVGEELYRTDGMPNSASMVADISAGTSGSGLAEFTEHNGELYFVADDGVSGSELWRSDGTAAGTFMVKDIWSGNMDSAPRELTSFNGLLFFSAETAKAGRELWTSDGTAAGTSLLVDISSGQAGSQPGELTVNGAGNKLFFRAKSNLGTELFVTQGTVATTVMVADINAGHGSSFPRHLFAYSGRVFFSAFRAAEGEALWTSDGTSSGTSLLKDIDPSSLGTASIFLSPAVMGGELYFGAADGVHGVELWKTDGTTAGTVLAADIQIGASSSQPSRMVEMGGALFFSCDAGGYGTELWRFDGTSASLVKDLTAGGLSSFIAGNGPILSHAGRLFFSYRNESLAISDGTLGGTFTISAVSGGDLEGTDSLTPLDATEIFFAGAPGDGNEELWQTDSSATGASLLAEVDPMVFSAGSNPTSLSTPDGKRALFMASDGTRTNGEPTMRAYWWDLMASPAVSVAIDIGPSATLWESKSDWPGTELHRAWLGDHELVFSSGFDKYTTGVEPWVTDMATGNSTLLRDLAPGPAYSVPTNFFTAKGLTYFQITLASLNHALVVSDGTLAGTRVIKDFNTGLWGGAINHFYELKDNVVFSATGGFGGNDALWATDGTTSGTNILANIFILPGDKQAVVDGEIIFRGDDSAEGSEPWVSDGTASGTHLLIALVPGPASGGITPLVEHEGLVFFSNKALFAPEDELWVSDLTVAGTHSVSTPHPGKSSTISEITSSEAGIFFVVSTQGGAELWVSDGTTAGTQAVAGAALGSSSSQPEDLFALGHGVFFTAETAEHGRELYYSDGTVSGTELVVDLWRGPESGGGSEFLAVGGDLLYRANDGVHGDELYQVHLSLGNVIDLGISGSGAQIKASTPTVGASIAVTGSGTPPGSLGLLAMSAPVSGPTSSLVLSGNANWLDFASLSILHVFQSPSFSYSQQIPALPSLVGGLVNLQALYLPAGGLPVETSNGLLLAIGR